MSNYMDDDIWRGFADMLRELFLKYGPALLEMEKEEDEAEHGQGTDVSNTTVPPPSIQ